MMIKILLVDDNLNVRKGLRNILTQSPQVVIVGETGDGKEALQLHDVLDPDIMILDVEMPGMKGYEVARQLKESGSETPILALSGYNEKHYILGMFASGAVGYLTKDEAPDQLLSAVNEVVAGRKGWLSPNAARMLGFSPRPVETDSIQSLTSLEKQILLSVRDAKTDSTIAMELDVELAVILTSIQSLMQKLGVKSRQEAVLRAMQEDLL
jgi:DNA-binding NarL/FixJ family response regulator